MGVPNNTTPPNTPLSLSPLSPPPQPRSRPAGPLRPRAPRDPLPARHVTRPTRARAAPPLSPLSAPPAPPSLPAPPPHLPAPSAARTLRPPPPAPSGTRRAPPPLRPRRRSRSPPRPQPPPPPPRPARRRLRQSAPAEGSAAQWGGDGEALVPPPPRELPGWTDETANRSAGDPRPPERCGPIREEESEERVPPPLGGQQLPGHVPCPAHPLGWRKGMSPGRCSSPVPARGDSKGLGAGWGSPVPRQSWHLGTAPSHLLRAVPMSGCHQNSLPVLGSFQHCWSWINPPTSLSLTKELWLDGFGDSQKGGKGCDSSQSPPHVPKDLLPSWDVPLELQERRAPGPPWHQAHPVLTSLG
ncbi:basic salivary proline-rich protein 1-like [Pithys albifrons albifrons]|uniref:basic salivary proline-rich protein 1-like n=1 Tax=Pithys albifrons albifrons TaxID=3385563 RepID=UPI003A5CDFF7